MQKYLIGIVCSVTFLAMNSLWACSRIFYADNTNAVMVARNMDWNVSLVDLMQTNLIVYPRGIQRNGNCKDNPLHWISHYGSIVATALHDTVATDGMNERGLAAHTLWFQLADYGKRNSAMPGLSIAMWVQFFLDNFQSVNEAVNYIQSNVFQIIPLTIPGTTMQAPQHLVLEDASGDSTIIEYIAGKPIIYHHSNYTVVTNEPSYADQLNNLLQYKGFGGDKPLPGTLIPKDRFVRASYYLARLPRPNSVQDEISKLFSVLQSVAEPYEITSEETPNPIPTLWQVIADLTHKVYYFHDATKLNLMWVNLNKFSLESGADAMKLDLNQETNLTGEVSDKFKPILAHE